MLTFQGIVQKEQTLKYILIIITLIYALQLKAQTDSTVLLKEVIISSGRINFSDGLKNTSYDSSVLIHYKFQTLSELLEENNSTYQKSYGPGGLSTLSLRGGSSYQTSVLWNGFPIASPLNGLSDLSLANIFLFDNVNIQYGGSSSLWGSGAISGTIHLNNKPAFNSKLKIIAGGFAGSFSNLQQIGGISIGLDKYYASLKIINTDNLNNFLYYPNNSIQQQTQKHSHNKQYGILGENHFRTGIHSLISLTAFHSVSNREIPPTPYQVNSDALQKDNNNRFTTEYKNTTSRNEYIIRSAYLLEQIAYTDDFVLQPSDNKSKTLINEASWERKLNEKHTFQIGINNTYSTVDSSANFSYRSINRFSVFTLYRYHSSNNKLGVSTGLRKEYSRKKNSPFVISFGLNYSPVKGLELLLAGSKVYRNPTLNDLYWLPGGNPDLNPEKGFSSEAGLNFKVFEATGIKKKFSSSEILIDATYFFRDINNWIIWYPSASSIWRPQNLLTVRSRGIESGIRFEYSGSNLTAGLTGNLYYTLSTNENTHLANDASLHKQLIYTPVYKYNTGFYVSYMSYGLRFNHAYTGYRYTSSDNLYFLEPYYIENAEIEKTITWKSLSARIFFSIKNLLNSNFESVLNRPMPLRIYQAGIIFTYKK